jgi:hypothetical protein
VLARPLREIAAGETLVVVRLDRLARSVSHLLSVVEASCVARHLMWPSAALPRQGIPINEIVGRSGRSRKVVPSSAAAGRMSSACG